MYSIVDFARSSTFHRLVSGFEEGLGSWLVSSPREGRVTFTVKAIDVKEIIPSDVPSI